MATMKALVKAKPEKGLWLQEVNIPEVGINDVLIKVKKLPFAELICISINGMSGASALSKLLWLSDMNMLEPWPVLVPE